MLARTTPDEPAPSLHPHYRCFITTTGRSAGAPRLGTQHLAVSAATVRSLSLVSPLIEAASCIGTRLPPFHTEAADQAHATSMPDTAWPVGGLPPGSSRDRIDAPVSMPLPKSRHVSSGSLSLVFLIPI